VLGTLEDGTPAVFMDVAYIKNATITSAKISELIADKIETGNLIADLQVKSKLWYGFEEFANGSSQTGFWLGVEGGVPKFKIDTGSAHGNKSLTYDGYDLKLTGDGLFDDIFVDSARFETISTNTISYNQRVVPSDYLSENGMGLNSNNYHAYLCATEQINKTTYNTGDPYDIYLTTGYLLVSGGTGYISVICQNSLINPYDKNDKTTFLRFKDKKISFTSRITGVLLSDAVGNNAFYTYFILYVSGKGQGLTHFEFNITSYLDTIMGGTPVSIPVTVSGKTLTVNFFKSTSTGTSTIAFSFTDSDEALNYTNTGHKVRVWLLAQYKYTYVGGAYLAVYRNVVTKVETQLNKLEYVPVSNIVSDALLE